MTSDTAARAVPLELTAAAAGTVLTVVLTDVSELPVAVWFDVDGPDGPLYDCLTVELAGPGGPRTLVLTGDRNASTSGRRVLEPGAAVTADLDLAAWARAEINGGAALAPGRHRATASYRCAEPDCWSGEVSAAPVPVDV
jgi:hypothetical protein